MAKLKAKRRNKLPATAFAYPKQRKYPINDRSHARNALARAASAKTFGTYAHVAAAVRRRFPDITTRGKARKKPAVKRSRRTGATGKRASAGRGRR